MPILLIDVLRAIWALRHNRRFVVLSVFAVLLVTGGTAFYWQVEHLRPLDAAYLTVTTLMTVGYGDLAPVTDAGKVFTSVFVVLGVALLLAFLTEIVEQVGRQSVLHRPLAGLAARRSSSRPAIDPAAGPTLDQLAGEYDVLVVGTSDASRRVAIEAARLGLRVVVTDPEQAR